jgi:quercetin dioxygenase-like cupin family protein
MDRTPARIGRRPREAETTGGSDERDARNLNRPVSRFELAEVIAQLRTEQAYSEGDRNALTLAKVESFRLVLVAFRAGAAFDEGDQRGTTALQVIEGGLAVRVGEESMQLGESQITVIGPGHPWSASALADGAMLIHLAWPPESGPVQD